MFCLHDTDSVITVFVFLAGGKACTGSCCCLFVCCLKNHICLCLPTWLLLNSVIFSTDFVAWKKSIAKIIHMGSIKQDTQHYSSCTDHYCSRKPQRSVLIFKNVSSQCRREDRNLSRWPLCFIKYHVTADLYVFPKICKPGTAQCQQGVMNRP